MKMCTPDVQQAAKHARLITRFTRQLQPDLPAWERAELLDTIAMHRAALAN
jgi:hypothetical protein